MKKIVLSSVLAVAATQALGGAATTGIPTTPGAAGSEVTVCVATVAGGGKASVYGGAGRVFTTADTPVFSQQGFDVQCSSNVELHFKEASTTHAGVISTSAKGNQVFGGSSNGGEVKALKKCASDPCNAAADIVAANWDLVHTDF